MADITTDVLQYKMQINESIVHSRRVPDASVKAASTSAVSYRNELVTTRKVKISLKIHVYCRTNSRVKIESSSQVNFWRPIKVLAIHGQINGILKFKILCDTLRYDTVEV